MDDQPGADNKIDSFPVLLPDWDAVPAHVRAFTTTRQGGYSAGVYAGVNGSGGLNLGGHVADDPAAVKQNRDKLNSSLPSDVIFLSQVHGNIALDVRYVRLGSEADAVFSTVPGKVCAVLTADCLPVLFADRAGKVVAAAHAGWRGLVGGVLEHTVNAMRSQGAGDIIAWMGPAIGPAEFEVGREVFDVFAARMSDAHLYFQVKPHTGNAEKYLADIYGLARNLLSNADVQQVYGGQHCTVTETDKFYSYRRDGVSGRMASLIWMDKV